MDTIVFANLGLVFFTAVLAGATIYYARVNKKLYKASKKQAKALNELTNTIRLLPRIKKHIELEEKMNKRKEEEKTRQQEKAVKGY